MHAVIAETFVACEKSINNPERPISDAKINQIFVIFLV